MEEKGQEMDKLQQELKDKEVENRIAGKKGDQLVRVCLFARFAFPLICFVMVVVFRFYFILSFCFWCFLSFFLIVFFSLFCFVLILLF